MIENIHVLRAVAAYMVVFYHGQDLTQAVSPAFDYVHAGAAGVDIFFVISGFVITHTNLRNQKTTTQFWLDRIMRIVPLYWAVTFFLILVSLSGWRPTGLHHWDAGDLLGSLFFIPNQRADGAYEPILSIGWTLNYEMFFYFAFGLCLIFVNTLTTVFTLTVIFSLFYLARKLTGASDPFFAFYSSPLLLEFLAGCGMALLYSRKAKLFQDYSAWAGIAAITTGILIIVANEILFSDLFYKYQDLRVLVFGIPAVMLLAGCLALHESGYKTSQPFVILQGNASYAIYLIHTFIFHLILKITEFLFVGKSYIAALIVFFVSTAIVCIAGTLLHLIVEKPAGAFTRRALSRFKLTGARAKQHAT